MVADVVYLEGGVGDVVLTGEEVFEVAPAGVAVLALADEDVGGESREAGGDGPDVEVVDLQHALCAGHPASHLPGIYALGGCFEEDVGRVAQELPGASEDQEPDRHADKRVRVAPAGEEEAEGGDCQHPSAQDLRRLAQA